MLKTVRRLKGYKRVVGHAEVHCDELLEYIRLCIEGEHYPFAVPDVPIDLNQYLATKDFTGGADLQLGDPEDEMFPGEHIRVLSIDSFPSHSFAGIMREMDAIPLAFRLTHQAKILNEMEAAGTHEKNMKMWRAKGTGGLKGQLRTLAVTDLDNRGAGAQRRCGACPASGRAWPGILLPLFGQGHSTASQHSGLAAIDKHHFARSEAAVRVWLPCRKRQCRSGVGRFAAGPALQRPAPLHD